MDIAKAAHTTIVVEAPGLGDDIQAIKAGITEIADIFVVNKADREGAESTALALEMVLDLNHRTHLSSQATGWRPPICKTIALHGEGIGAVVEAIERHRTYLLRSGEMEQHERERIETELREMVSQEITRRFFQRMGQETIEGLVDRIASRELDPYSALAMLLEE